MEVIYFKFVLFLTILAVCFDFTLQCPDAELKTKSAYNSGEIPDMNIPFTLEKIKQKLKDSGIFDWQNKNLTESEKKEMNRLFDAVEIMTTSRNRQPYTAQNMFSALRMVERAVKKQCKEGQLSVSLAAKFHWENLPDAELRAKSAYKSGEILDMSIPFTLEKIKQKLKDSGIFDWQNKNLTEGEKKEMNKLFDAVKIMTTPRNHQPYTAQNMFSALRLVERAVKKQLKEGQLSNDLAAKFHWENLSVRNTRNSSPLYYYDKATKMRVFTIE